MAMPTDSRNSASTVHPASAAAAGNNAGAIHAATPFSMLISRHLFQDGEIVELAMRPSLWWIFFSSLHALLIAAAIILAGFTFCDFLPGHRGWYLEIGVLIALTRLMWATIKWSSRLYVLTNMRVMTISGVFNVTAQEIPLRRLARVRNISALRERLLWLGSLELIPLDENFAITSWVTIRRPREVKKRIRAAMERAQQGTPPPA